MELKDKKVLMMGLGILGGGIATAKWLIRQGADLTVTDLKSKEELAKSLEELKEYKDKIKYVLEDHRGEDFLNNEIIVINPDVSINNKFVQLAVKNGKQIENELTLFFKFCPSRNIVAITGTRGKTTVVNWIYHILRSKYPDTVLAGNSFENPFLKMVDKCTKESKVVLEVPSYHLELLEEENPKYAPKVAVITNVYQDHLNRHGSLENYARTKANIFKNQKETDFLILNKDNKWTTFFESLKPKARIFYFFKTNLEAATLAVKMMGLDEETIKNAISSLPQIKFRQEKVYEDEHLEIYNDTTATSPEATIFAINKLKGDKNFILITGGTDRELEFSDWAKVVKENINQDNLILLSGSATEKMKKFLGENKYNEFDSLSECLEYALKRSEKNKSIILFSPSSKSFEKFKNEYDRGEQFNKLINQL